MLAAVSFLPSSASRFRSFADQQFAVWQSSQENNKRKSTENATSNNQPKQSDKPTQSNAAAAVRPRGCPLGSVVGCLVEGWSREFREKSNQGNIEAMCAVAKLASRTNGFGSSIPHNPVESRQILSQVESLSACDAVQLSKQMFDELVEECSDSGVSSGSDSSASARRAVSDSPSPNSDSNLYPPNSLSIINNNSIPAEEAMEFPSTAAGNNSHVTRAAIRQIEAAVKLIVV